MAVGRRVGLQLPGALLRRLVHEGLAGRTRQSFLSARALFSSTSREIGSSAGPYFLCNLQDVKDNEAKGIEVPFIRVKHFLSPESTKLSVIDPSLVRVRDVLPLQGHISRFPSLHDHDIDVQNDALKRWERWRRLKRKKDPEEEVSVPLIVARKGAVAYGYINKCPHARLPLEWFPDRFMSEDNEFLQCSSHGALFEVETGLCVGGPCVGKSLMRLPLTVNDGEEVFLEAKTDG